MNILYVYQCTTCGHHDKEYFTDDTHDGDETECASCGAVVRLEWDGGVSLATTSSTKSTYLTGRQS